MSSYKSIELGISPRHIEKAPVKRLAVPNVPIPYSRPLEQFVIPQVQDQPGYHCPSGWPHRKDFGQERGNLRPRQADRPAQGIDVNTAFEEQAWNGAQLAALIGVPRFRVWTHRSPAVVLGNSQRSLRNAIEQRIEGRVELISREAGGGAVLTGPWMVTTSIVLPHGHPLLGDSLLGCYRWLGQLHAAALAELGVPVYAMPAPAVPVANARIDVRTVKWACFGGLSPWEVVDAGYRKVVGLAQRRRQAGVLLVAGALVGATDWHLLCDVMGHPEDEVILRRRTVSCEELAARSIEPEALAFALTRAIGNSLAPND